MTKSREYIEYIAKSREICQIYYKKEHSASNCRKLTNFGTEILVYQICNADTVLINVDFAIIG